MEYEMSKVILEMTPPEFETVMDVLQEFCTAFAAGAFDELPVNEKQRIKDKVLTIKKLKFSFEQHEEEQEEGPSGT